MQDTNYLSKVCVLQLECTVGGDIVRLTGAQTQHAVQGKVFNSHYTKRTDFGKGEVLAQCFAALVHIAPHRPCPSLCFAPRYSRGFFAAAIQRVQAGAPVLMSGLCCLRSVLHGAVPQPGPVLGVRVLPVLCWDARLV